MPELLIMGAVPPPIGGVTIHVKRLLEQLLKENIKYQYIAIRHYGNFRWIKYILSFVQVFKFHGKIVHYQLNNWYEAAIYSLMFRLQGKKFIYTVHSFPVSTSDVGFIKRTAFYITKSNTTLFIAPSPSIQKKLIDSGVPQCEIKVLNTFLPPSEDELEEEIPGVIREFKECSDRRLVLANASCLYLNDFGEDVYGLDLCIDACSAIPEISIAFICPVIKDEAYYKRCLARIHCLGIEHRFLIYTNPISLPSLFKIADLFIRPSASDSYGISIEEALSCGVPAVASNVCERTQGTILFERRDKRDFIEKIKYALNCKVVDYKKADADYWKNIYAPFCEES